RAGPLQARPPHRRRRRRLPPRRLPRRHGQDPLPAPPRLDDPGPRPARDPHPARAPPGLLRPADHHRPPGRARQDRAETRLPPSRPAPPPPPPAPAADRGSPPPKAPAPSHITRGWCRLMGLAPLMLFTATLLVARNQRILAAWNARQQENQRRAAKGLPPKTR